MNKEQWIEENLTKEEKIVGDKAFQYVKHYGKTPMHYSEEYLAKTPLEELIKKDSRNQRLFQ